MYRIAIVIGLIAAFVAASVIPAGAHIKTATSPTNLPAGLQSERGLESQLFRIVTEIDNNNLDKALENTEALIKEYPNFRLAYLIKGDLLLARSAPLSTFGNAENVPQEKLDDLRDEIMVRLRAYRDRATTTENIPRYLLQMPPEQKHAIVVDTRKSRLFVYANDTKANGHPRLVADYYISQGKLGAGKMREGDKKTPTGVYHVTSSLSPKKVGEFYGTGAFPINYPNEWDKRLGRSGHGIWLHGTPPNTFSRPPKASDGCVVLANTDLDELATKLQIGMTPVIISDSVEWLTPDEWKKERKDLIGRIEAWRRDWESRNIDRYISNYANEFQNNGQTLKEFTEQKRRVNDGKEWIKVKLSDLSVFRNPGNDDMAVVTFEQDYQSNNLTNRMKKRQYWIREDGTWKILYEGAA